MYLLDTNAVSELRRPKPRGGVTAWLRTVPDKDVYLSAVTLGELQAGVEATREQDPAKARSISVWIDQIAASFNLLSMAGPAFRIWAQLQHRRPDHLSEDAMIAATAISNRLTVATRNFRDFKDFDVAVFDPFGFRS